MRGPAVRCTAALLALLVAAHTLPAAAEQAERVAIAGSGSPELGRKLRAELSYAGFGAADSTSAPRAPATVLVLAPDRVQLTVQSTSDGDPFTQTLDRAPGEGDSFALRIVEVLRARLVDVGWTLPEPERSPEPQPSPEPAASEPPEPGAATAPEAEPAPLPAAAEAEPSSGLDPAAAPSGGLGLWLGAGALGSWAPGGLGITPHAALSARVEPGRAWGATLLAQLPLRDGAVAAEEGEARIAWTALSAAVDHRLPLAAPWLCSLGLGAALFVLDAAGQAQPQFSGRRERLTAGAGFALLGVGRELSSWLRLRALALAGAAAPRPVLRFDGREVAGLGSVFGSLGLQLELGWPGAREAAQ